MSITLQTDPLLLREDPDGGLRIGQTRILVELVLRAFQDRATPETIVQRYPTLGLVDVYAVITHYLQHREEMDRYLAERERRAKEVRERIERGQGDMAEIRAKLLAQQDK
ncbi:MAG: DUF433 domain-containing protein [Pirellulales bacterium]|nr:DUF433 domain-containing protein [Pirellulales bacterium]